MEKRGVLTKILAFVGTFLMFFPILAPVLFSLARFVERGAFQLDYLMPA